jgi:hypothetical protein
MNPDGTFQVGMNGVRFSYPDQYQGYCASRGFAYSNTDERFAHVELWAFSAPYKSGDSGIRLIASPELGLTMWNSIYPPSPANSSLIFVGYAGDYQTPPLVAEQSLSPGTWYLTAFLYLDDPGGSLITSDMNFSQALVISGGFNPPPPSEPTVIPAVGLWWNPNESGSGYALDFKHGVLVVTVYSYAPNGAPQWYLTAGPLNGKVFSATLDKFTFGQCISCAYRGSPSAQGNDGVMTITFSSSTSATVQLPGGRITAIQPQAF